MWIYIINFFTIILYGFVIKNKKAYVSISLFQCFLILSLRAPTLGVDLLTYSDGYDYISTLSFKDMLTSLHFLDTADLISPFNFESGYTFVNWLCAHFGLTFHAFLCLHAAFCLFSIGKFINRYSEDPKISFSLFLSFGFFTYLFGILRQTMAMSVFLLATKYIIDRKPFKFFLSVIVAFTIHRAVIIILPLYWITRIRITKRLYLMLYIFILVFFAASPILVQQLLTKILVVFKKTSYSLNFSLNNLILLMLIIGLFIYAITKFNILHERNSCNNFLLWTFLFAIVTEVCGLYNDVVARIVQIPFMAIVALLPNVINAYHDKSVARLGKVAVISLCFLFMILQLSSSIIVPYVSIFA